MEKPEVLLEPESVSGIKVSFESNGKKYVNFVIDEETAQNLKAQGIDVEAIVREERKKDISQTTDIYIQQKLQEIDEDLADLTSEAQVIEGRILYIAAKEGITVTTDEVKQKIALFIAGSYTEQDAVNDLKEKGLSDETIQKILPLLQRGVEIAKILNWKEEIWAKEGELEDQIDGMHLEELLQLDVRKLCQEAYSQIPLEV